MRRRSRLGLDLPEERNPVLVTAEDFVSLVAGLARQLDPTPDPVPQPPIFEGVRPVPAYPEVMAATRRLRGLLDAKQVSRFTLSDGGILA
jgi:hypothetical protein